MQLYAALLVIVLGAVALGVASALTAMVLLLADKLERATVFCIVACFGVAVASLSAIGMGVLYLLA